MRYPVRRARRATTLITSLTVALVALTGCGSSENAAPSADGSSAAGGVFPVAIDSALGKAVIEEKPDHVVTLGTGSAGISIALGVIPGSSARSCPIPNRGRR